MVLDQRNGLPQWKRWRNLLLTDPEDLEGDRQGAICARSGGPPLLSMSLEKTVRDGLEQDGQRSTRNQSIKAQYGGQWFSRTAEHRKNVPPRTGLGRCIVGKMAKHIKKPRPETTRLECQAVKRRIEACIRVDSLFSQLGQQGLSSAQSPLCQAASFPATSQIPRRRTKEMIP